MRIENQGVKADWLQPFKLSLRMFEKGDIKMDVS